MKTIKAMKTIIFVALLVVWDSSIPDTRICSRGPAVLDSQGYTDWRVSCWLFQIPSTTGE